MCAVFIIYIKHIGIIGSGKSNMSETLLPGPKHHEIMRLQAYYASLTLSARPLYSGNTCADDTIKSTLPYVTES